MSSTRQLAAIMFADIVGYTAMMQEDEALAMNWRQKLKKKLEEEVVAHQGKILEFRGDGAMCSFVSTIEGVRAAVALQLNMQSEPVVPLRIGMHTGDVIFDENNIYGDGVNIASRLESFALPGSIFISGKAFDDIKNQKDIQSISLGKYILKNVKEQVEIFAISNPGIKIPETDMLEGKGEKFTEKKSIEKSIAVLPFLNMSNDPEQEYFSDGITEEIVNLLTHIKDLRVAGRTSSFHFKGRDIDIRLVGQKLNVRTLLEGSIRKQNLRLRITAQLINAEDGIQLWSERYDRELHDIFAIQDEIAFAITEELKTTLLEKDKVLINENRTGNKEAYDLYLKGRFYLNQRGVGIRKALQYFQQAVDKDPEFSLPYSGMADAYFILGFYGTLPTNIAMTKARQNAEMAIQFDNSNAEGLMALACISAFYDWNWTEAKKSFQRVFEVNPNYAPAHCWYSYYLSFVEGKTEDGIKEARKAAELLEPFESISHHVLSVTFMAANRFEEALEAAKMAIDFDPSSFPGYRALGVSLAGLNRYEEAIEALTTCALLSSRHVWPLGELCWVYSLSGRVSEAQKILDELIARAKTEYISGLFLAGPAYFSKNYDQALEFIELAFEQRDCTLPFIKAYPPCSYIKSDKRFQPFIKRMNFPE
jgi:TolB-like protein/class 3 adenylate cyclase/Tfp pilus assembly protein PilF